MLFDENLSNVTAVGLQMQNTAVSLSILYHNVVFVIPYCGILHNYDPEAAVVLTVYSPYSFN